VPSVLQISLPACRVSIFGEGTLPIKDSMLQPAICEPQALVASVRYIVLRLHYSPVLHPGVFGIGSSHTWHLLDASAWDVDSFSSVTSSCSDLNAADPFIFCWNLTSGMHDIQLEKLRCMPTAMHCWTVNSDAMLATIVQPLIFNRKLQRLRQHVPQLLLYRLFDLFALHVTCSETADTTRSMVLHFFSIFALPWRLHRHA